MFFILLLFTSLLNLLKAENFCVNCKFFKPSFFSKHVFAKCSVFPKKLDFKEIDYLVTGTKNEEYIFCSTARYDENKCGTKGKYFEKKEDPLITFLCKKEE